MCQLEASDYDNLFVGRMNLSVGLMEYLSMQYLLLCQPHPGVWRPQCSDTKISLQGVKVWEV